MTDERLPDTNDPFELLGVEPDADARTLKRAYVRLIKRFRPERSPDAFKRIHAAYQRAQQRALLDAAWDEADDADLASEPEADEEQDAGAVDDDDDEWEEALQERVEEQRKARAIVARIYRHIVRDQIAELLDCVESEEIESACHREESVEEAVVMGLAAAQWSDPERAAASYARLAGPAQDQYHHEIFLDMLSLYPDWRDANKRHACPELLSSVMRLGRVMPPNEKRALVRDMVGEMREWPEAYATFLGGMTAEGPAIFAHYRVCIASVGLSERIPIPARPVEESREIKLALHRLSHEAARRSGIVPLYIVMGVSGAAVIAGFAATLAPGLFSVMALILVGGAGVRAGLRDRVFRRIIRPALFDLGLEYGLGPDATAQWLRDSRSAPRTLRSYHEEVDGDGAMYAAALAHTATRTTEDLVASYGDWVFDPPPLDEDEEEERLSTEELRQREAERAERRRRTTRRDMIVAGVAVLLAILLPLLALLLLT